MQHVQELTADVLAARDGYVELQGADSTFKPSYCIYFAFHVRSCLADSLPDFLCVYPIF